MTVDQISRLIRTVANFPKPGVNFKDITPVLENSEAFRALSKHLAEKVNPQTDKLVAIESRGFILGAAVAQHLSCGLVIVRKPGKLPRETIREDYVLEYGSDSVEIHKDSLKPGDRVTIIDDVLATGGTASAVEKLCEKAGAQVLGSIFMMSIESLDGKSKLTYPNQSLL
ncbi:MAG: adenine phosphoribosyltransferase [Bdellovibrionales bacterium]|nr:adenine phosphoribosyltransferase [Bdellovibrionales bacterium]